MIGIGVLRLAADAWNAADGALPLHNYLEAGFSELQDNLI